MQHASGAGVSLLHMLLTDQAVLLQRDRCIVCFGRHHNLTFLYR